MARARARAEVEVWEAEQRSGEALAARLKEARDRFREGLEGLREESFALARSGGPAVARWRGSVWEGWDAAAAKAAGGCGGWGCAGGGRELVRGG
jgi:hypothetical protein